MAITWQLQVDRPIDLQFGILYYTYCAGIANGADARAHDRNVYIRDIS